jgi:uncharacterized glyoxalase superfamily protein PhnB
MITPYLYYEDVKAALVFLSKAFGFKKFGRPMSAMDGKIQHAAMKFGDALVMMGYPVRISKTRSGWEKLLRA